MLRTIPVVLVTGMLCSSALAQDVAITLELNVVGVDCPDRETFVELVTSRLGRNPVAERANHHVLIDALPRAGGHAGSLRVLEGSRERGRRELQVDGSCADLMETLAVSLAIFLEETMAPSESEPHVSETSSQTAVIERDSQEPTPTSAVPTDTASQQALPSQTPSALELQFVGEVGVAGMIGTAPAFTLGPRLELGLIMGRFSLRLQGTFDAQLHDAGLSTGDTVYATHSAAALVGCLHYHLLNACVLGGGGVLSARVHEVVESRTRISPSVFAGVRLAVVPQLNELLFLSVFGELRIAIARSAIDVNDLRAWEQSPVAGRFGLALGLRI